MPLISASLIKSSRTFGRYCARCEIIIDYGFPCIRLFGYACDGDLPYPIFFHPECMREMVEEQKLPDKEHEKIAAAINAYLALPLAGGE